MIDTSLVALSALKAQCWVYSALLGIVSLFLVVCISSVVANGPDAIKRRRTMSLISVLVCAGLFWLFMQLYVANAIQVPLIRQAFMATNWECFSFTLGVPVLGVLIFAGCEPTSKVGSLISGEEID